MIWRGIAPVLGSAALLAGVLLIGKSTGRTVTVDEGTNVNVAISPDRKTIVMDLQETLWSLPVGGGSRKG